MKQRKWLLGVALGVSTTVVASALWALRPAEGQSGTRRPGPRVPFEERLWTYLTEDNPYWEWDEWPGYEGFQPGTAPHGAFLRVYVNSYAQRDLATLPPYSMIVKENYMEEDPESLAAITVMYRSEGYDPEHYDWYWVKYLPDGSVDEMRGMTLAGRVQGCIECHSGAGGDDFTFMNDE